ncbi:MAG: hypothetical protein AAF633_24330 [Chloroflexota bacterium]
MKTNRFLCLFPVIVLLLLVGCRNSVEEGGPPTGKIITLVRGEAPDNRIVSLDVETQAQTVIFQAPELSVVQELATSPDGNTVYFSYTPPPSIETGFFDRAAIYRMGINDSEPVLLLGGALPDEFYTNPTLSPDGRYLFYHRLGQDYSATDTRFIFGIERLDLQTMQTSPLLPNGIWPRLSSDGEKMVFITLDLNTQQRGLAFADIDGSNMRTLLPIGSYFDIDSPMFSVDGSAVYFSIVEEGAQTSWFDRLLGVKVAHAHIEHNIPSTWWRLELEGGNLEQISSQAKIVAHAYRHPTKDQIMYTTLEGVFMLDVVSREIVPVSEGDRFGTLQWIP